MLEIDYSLVPMAEADVQFVRAEVERRVQDGEIPPPDRAVNGRLTLLNPDLVQTVHQIPDDLRPRLRRILLPAQQGSTHLTAKRLHSHIVESDERLYAIVIELQSEFRAFADLLDYLPGLRALYPDLAVFLSGTLPNLRAKLQQVLAAGGATLVLEFDGGERIVEIGSAEEFERRIATQEQVVTYSTPFFTDIRLKLDKTGRPIPFNLLSLRKLQAVFGQGEAEEVEVGKGRRERMVIVDLPVPLVHDFRFRQDRGLDFLGVVINGETIQSRHFGDEKLEFRWVPLAAIEQFLRRSSAGTQEAIDMKEVGALRVNTLTGEVSFLIKNAGEQVAVELASAIAFRKTPKAVALAGDPGDPDSSGGPAEQVIAFDRFIQPSSHSAHLDPMQEAVRAHFFHKLIGEEVEHTRKREIYAQRMRAAAVGPLAGQTLKILRRHGLERLIDPASFFYLCDTTEEVPYYRNTPRRYEEHFQNLVQVMREVVSGGSGDQVRVNDMTFNMPISTEWIDAGLASLDNVTNPELEAVYHEMRLLSDFIAHEFKRNFDLQQEDLTFFEKMQSCRDASLLAKWLSEYKRGAYGEPLPPDVRPDVVFYGTEDDKKENDTRFYFPSLSCAQLLQSPAGKDLFDQFDYDFSVFLEDQMALAVHFSREDGVLKPGAQEFAAYFARMIEQTQGQTEELREMLAAIDDENSPIYRQMLEQEEQAYRERYEQFLADRERVEAELDETTSQVDELVGEIKPQLDRGEATETEFFRETPGHPELLEQRLLGAAGRTQERIKVGLETAFGSLTAHIDAWRANLEQFVLQMRRTLQHHAAWQTAQDAWQIEALREQWQSRISGRMEQLRRAKPLDRDQMNRRLQTQLRNYQGELNQINARLADQQQKHQRAAATLHSYVQSAGARLATLRELEPGTAPKRVVGQSESLRKLLENIASNAATLAGRMEQMQENVDKIRLQRQRFAQQLFQLRAELALIRAVEERSEPVLPKPKVEDGKVPEQAEVEQLEQTSRSLAASLVQARQGLAGGGAAVPEAIQTVRGEAIRFQRFGERREHLIKAVTRKARLRASAQSLGERKTLMDEELQDLPQRVRERFMPARKKLLVDVFLPETEHRIVQFDKARTFVSDLLRLPTEPLKETYLDHAIFRRFYGRQFMRGGAYASDANSRMAFPTRNVAPALRLMVRALTHNYKRNRMPGVERVQLPVLSHQSGAQILLTIANLAAVAGRGQFDYLVLPPTMELKEGLELLHKKDALYEGVPRLVLIFVTKFNPLLLRQDAELRDAYHRALKHNIVLNIDGRVVVDNPRSIGMRLLNETLGCAIDLPDIEEPPEVASAAD